MHRVALISLILWASVALSGSPVPALASDWSGWAADTDYDPAIPDPESWLGRPWAQEPMSVDEVLDYVTFLSDVSPRIEVEAMGTSVQGDALLLVVATDPRNRPALIGRTARLENIRDAWGQDRAQRLQVARETLPVSWIACSVHGDEASGTDAGVFLAWHLAADRSARSREILESSVVLIDPCQNPDGRRRFLQQIRSFGRQKMAADASPWAAEHWSVWPGARTNHFLFDLNRDWAFLTQDESRARVAAFLRWRPQVFVDLHEMGRQSSYFFPPPTAPINPNIPEEQLAWFDRFGRENARAFDERGFDYFVGESFDLFYPGFGDSWPTLQGAIGMTYEQATTRGRRMRRLDGRVAGYAEAVEHHFVAALTTIETTARNGAALLESLVDFGDAMRERAEADPREEIVISPRGHRAEARRLAGLLRDEGIRVLRTTEEATVQVSRYGDPVGDVAEHRLPAGSFRVPLAQPAYALARNLLDIDTPMEPEFIAEQESRIEQGLRSRFYDVTAWSMILGHGVEAFESTRILEVPSENFVDEETPPAVEVPDAVLGWLVPFDGNGIYSALAAMWREDIAVHCALEGVGHGDTLLPRGTLVIKRAANPDRPELAAILGRIATSTGVELMALNRSYSSAGPSIGSDRVVLLPRSTVGLLSGPGVAPLSAGALTWMFEERYGLDFSVVLLDALGDVDLHEFGVLVVPELRKGGKLPLDRLDGWVREGGVLIVIGSASLALIEQSEEEGVEAWTTVKHVSDLAELGDEEGRLGDFEVGERAMDTKVARGSSNELPPERRPLRIPGAIFRVDLDPTHFLTIGKPATIAVPVLSDRILTPSISGRTVGRIDASEPVLAGYTWPVMTEALKDQAWLVEERRGRGRVVLFAEDPSFRGTWEGLHGLLLNAVMLAPGVRR